jgi:hypothetical protein
VHWKKYSTKEIALIAKKEGKFNIPDDLNDDLKKTIKQRMLPLFEKKILNRVPVRRGRSLDYRFIPKHKRAQFIQPSRPKQPSQEDLLLMLESGHMTFDTSKKSTVKQRQMLSVLGQMRSEKKVTRQKLGDGLVRYTVTSKPKIENALEAMRETYKGNHRQLTRYQLCEQLNATLVEFGMKEASPSDLGDMLDKKKDGYELVASLIPSSTMTPENESEVHNDNESEMALRRRR